MLPNRNPGIPLWMGKLKIKCKHSDYWCVFNDVKVTLEIGGTVVVFTATKCPCQTVGTANDSSWGTSQGCVDGWNGFENEVLFTRMLEAIRVKWKHWFNSPAVVSTKYQHITSRFHFAFGLVNLPAVLDLIDVFGVAGVTERLVALMDLFLRLTWHNLLWHFELLLIRFNVI